MSTWFLESKLVVAMKPFKNSDKRSYVTKGYIFIEKNKLYKFVTSKAFLVPIKVGAIIMLYR